MVPASLFRAQGLELDFILKKTKLFIIILFLMSQYQGFSQVAINSTGSPPDPDAMLDVSSNQKGLMIPRISFSNRPPASKTGMLIYQTDNTPGFYFADGSNWIRTGNATMDYWLPASGSDIRFPDKIALGSYIDAMGHGLNAANYATAKSAVRGTIEIGGMLFAEGMLGILDPSSLGVPLAVTNVGVLGIKPNIGSNGAAIYGWNNQNHVNGNFAGLFVSNGNGSADNYAVYGRASGGSNNYAGYYKGRMKIEGNSFYDSAPDSLNTVQEVKVMHHYYNDTKAVYGVSRPQPGWGIGIYGEGGYHGTFGYGDGSTYTGLTSGVYGYSTGSAGTRVGVYGKATNYGGSEATGVYGEATGSTGTIATGVFGYASGGTTNWAGFFLGTAYISNDLRIGTTTQASGYALSVNGKVACEEVLVELDSGWPDYVFDEDYPLPCIGDLEKHIQENGCLPGLPSAEEVNEDGLQLGEMQKKIVEKIEELTLYTINQQKMIDQLAGELQQIKAENERLRALHNY
jgi:hypothetical protein